MTFVSIVSFVRFVRKSERSIDARTEEEQTPVEPFCKTNDTEISDTSSATTWTLWKEVFLILERTLSVRSAEETQPAERGRWPPSPRGGGPPAPAKGLTSACFAIWPGMPLACLPLRTCDVCSSFRVAEGSRGGQKQQRGGLSSRPPPGPPPPRAARTTVSAAAAATADPACLTGRRALQRSLLVRTRTHASLQCTSLPCLNCLACFRQLWSRESSEAETLSICCEIEMYEFLCVCVRVTFAEAQP